MTHFTKCCKILGSSVLEDCFNQGRLSRVKKLKRTLEGFEQYFHPSLEKQIKLYIKMRVCNTNRERFRQSPKLRSMFFDVLDLFDAIDQLVNSRSKIKSDKAVARLKKYVPKHRFDRHDFKQTQKAFL